MIFSQASPCSSALANVIQMYIQFWVIAKQNLRGDSGKIFWTSSKSNEVYPGFGGEVIIGGESLQGTKSSSSNLREYEKLRRERETRSRW